MTWLVLAIPGWCEEPADSVTVRGGTRALDVEGNIHEIGRSLEWLATVVVFLDPACPLSQQYVPELNRLAASCAPRAVELIGVLSRPDLSRQRVLGFRDEYAVRFALVHDTLLDLFEQLRPTHVPECFVIRRDGVVSYRGRVDDLYPEVGKKRPAVTVHDLEDAVAALARGDRLVRTATSPVGCLIEYTVESAVQAPVNFARHVAPLLYTNCVACHRSSEVAPFELWTYADASLRARQIAEVTARGFMPPWPSQAQHHEFRDVRRLGERQIRMLESWAEQGALEGDAAELPGRPKFADGWTLGEPDLVVELPEDFDVDADGPDVFRCFVLPSGLEEDQAVVGIEFRPGNPRVVHHALLFLDDQGEARQLDARDTGPGYRGFGGPGFMSARGLGGWAPGATPQTFPSGMGREVRKGDDIVVQIHYHPSGKQEKDKSRLGLFFAKQPVTHLVRGMVMGRMDLDIPAGAADYERSATLELPVPVTLVGIAPHMHWIGKQMKVDAELPDGTWQPLIWIRDWDFNWQGQYRYAEPLELPQGTRIHMQASFNNSAANPYNPSSPPRRVSYGEETFDEMCFCFLQWTSTDLGAEEALRRASARSFMLSARARESR